MDPEPACQAYFRCLFAIERCIDFQAQGPRPPASAEAEQELLESLLIEHWHLEGIEWAERRYRPAGARRPRVFV